MPSKNRVSVKRTAKRSSKSAPRDPLSRRNMVLITGPKIDVTGLNKVAQIVEKSRNGHKFAVRLNYNGQLLVCERKHLRKATDTEKKKDKKLHSRELSITSSQSKYLNA